MGLSPGAEARRPPSPDRRGLGARRAAAAAHGAVVLCRQPLDEALAISCAALDARDAALARSIATATLRHGGTIARALEARLASGMPKKSGDLVALLATATAQILFLDVPDHAAVDAAVALARDDHRSAGYAGLANAVLRRIAEAKAQILASPAEPLAEFPDWLSRRWIANWGPAKAASIAAAIRQEAYVDIRAKSEPDRWAEKLGGTLLANGSIRLAARRPVADQPGYGEGEWWVQDVAASTPVIVLAPRAGERVLDLCAAPGGKTAQIAATGAAVVAVDRSAPRMRRLGENLARLRLSAEQIVADAATLDTAPADAVLLDAPCSATGTIRRNPDVAWTKSPADIARFATLQERLLARAFALTRPGGRLIYATCSLEPEEGEQRIAAFLAAEPAIRRVPIQPAEAPGFEQAITPDGDLRIFPDMIDPGPPFRAGADGFFIARLERES